MVGNLHNHYDSTVQLQTKFFPPNTFTVLLSSDSEDILMLIMYKITFIYLNKVFISTIVYTYNLLLKH